MHDRLLDLGAGGGWCSDLLQRLNRSSVAVDISLDMLRVARQRPTSSRITAVAGDLERLPFVNGAFDKAICLNALHHVPDMDTAVHEVARVLDDEGVAVFSEPGIGHSAMPISTAAVRDYGVLEQEILIEPFIESCRRAGFTHVRVCPIAYVIPEFQLSPEDWSRWKQLPRQKRPLRALEKIWRAGLEFFGLGKQSILFEEAFAMRLVRLFQQPVEEHPFIVASKKETSLREQRVCRASIEVVSAPRSVRPLEAVRLELIIGNTGTTAWQTYQPTKSESGQVRIGVQLLDSASRVITRDFARGDFDSEVQPGESGVVRTTFNAPAEPGQYVLKFDVVAE